MDQLTLLAILIIVPSFLLESLFGFGGGLLAIPLLSFLLGVKDAVTLVLVFQFLMGILIVRAYRDTNWKMALPMIAGLLIGTIIGIYALSLVSDSFLRKFLAFSILAFLLRMVFFKDASFSVSTPKQGAWGFLVGVVGGGFQGIIGTGGPVLTMYLALVLPEKRQFRATLITLFFVTSVVRVIASGATGLLSSRILTIALPILPVFLIAVFLGQLIHRKIEDKYFRYAVQTILLFSAISMLLKA